MFEGGILIEQIRFVFLFRIYFIKYDLLFIKMMNDCIDLFKAETSRYNSIRIKIQRSCSYKDYQRAFFNGEILQ